MYCQPRSSWRRRRVSHIFSCKWFTTRRKIIRVVVAGLSHLYGSLKVMAEESCKAAYWWAQVLWKGSLRSKLSLARRLLPEFFSLHVISIQIENKYIVVVLCSADLGRMIVMKKLYESKKGDRYHITFWYVFICFRLLLLPRKVPCPCVVKPTSYQQVYYLEMMRRSIFDIIILKTTAMIQRHCQISTTRLLIMSHATTTNIKRRNTRSLALPNDNKECRTAMAECGKWQCHPYYFRESFISFARLLLFIVGWNKKCGFLTSHHNYLMRSRRKDENNWNSMRGLQYYLSFLMCCHILICTRNLDILFFNVHGRKSLINRHSHQRFSLQPPYLVV